MFGLGGKKTIVCPECRSRGAVKAFTGVKCPNRSCRNYDASLPPSLATLPTATRPGSALSGSFNPGANAITIRYRNHRGEEAEYVGDKTTVRSIHEHISVRVAPTGKRIALAKKFIQNLAQLPPAAAAPMPSGTDRQILSFHSRRGSTSARYEELRRKYPHWQPQ